MKRLIGTGTYGIRSYIEKNIAFIKNFTEQYLDGVTMTGHEGTYLVWLDFRNTGYKGRELDRLILQEAEVWLDSGSIFGDSGEGFQRINAACPGSVLEEALHRIKKALNKN